MIRQSISLGICKVNVATDLKIAFSKALKIYSSEYPDANDPRKYITPGKQAMQQVVENKIIMYNSADKI